MPSIDDFIAHRWADAREVLRGMDPEYVEVFERKTDVSAERQRVTHPIDATDKPRRSLPGEWHRILESCEQLSMQISPVEMAADGLHSVAAIGLDPIETGKRSDYHIRSWFVHMSALGGARSGSSWANGQTLRHGRPSGKGHFRYMEESRWGADRKTRCRPAQRLCASQKIMGEKHKSHKLSS